MPDSTIDIDVPGWDKVYGIDRWPNIRAIFLTLYKAVEQRWDDVEWRATKYYIAANLGPETFLVARTRMQNLPVGLALPPGTSHPRLSGEVTVFSWRRITGAIDLHSTVEIDEELLSLIDRAYKFVGSKSQPGKKQQRVSLGDLLESGLLVPDAQLVLKTGTREVAEARLTSEGQIDLDGATYDTPSNAAFARLLGPTRTSLNGWRHWYVRLPGEDILLDDYRQRFRSGQGVKGRR